MHIPTLTDKMIKSGTSDVVLTWILSILDTRRCKMRFGTCESERTFEVSSGLPQSSPLSCVNIYTADVIGWTQGDNTDAYSYVNDMALAVPVSPLWRLLQISNSANDKLQAWTQSNHMKVQRDKVTRVSHWDKRCKSLTLEKSLMQDWVSSST